RARFLDILSEEFPIISSSFELLFDKYCKIPITIRNVDVLPVKHKFNNINKNINNTIPNTGSFNLLSSTVNSNKDELRESLVDTTLSILKMLLQCFIILIILARQGQTPTS
ncbi:hypothetical protein PIROE2DRAFT_2469, partial [Piromyces sp. E2]